MIGRSRIAAQPAALCRVDSGVRGPGRDTIAAGFAQFQRPVLAEAGTTSVVRSKIPAPPPEKG